MPGIVRHLSSIARVVGETAPVPCWLATPSTSTSPRQHGLAAALLIYTESHSIPE